MKRRSFHPGITTILSRHPNWIEGCRIGLVTHPAALDCRGTHSITLLSTVRGTKLVSVFGPEHGFFGNAGAGTEVSHEQHPILKIPIYSLYGQNRKPTSAMLREIDTIVIDLQDLAARPYTYVSTLKLVLEAAHEHNKRVIVADRPVPLPNIVDGPTLQPSFSSFVASIPAPMAYGMTPGETALWLKNSMSLDLDLKVAAMTGYHRESCRSAQWPPWIPPSPGIKYWRTGWLYLSTVFTEAIPALDNGRGTALAFQVFGAPWLNPEKITSTLESRNIPGIAFHVHHYIGAVGSYKGRLLPGIRMNVENPDRFHPVTTSIHIMSAISQVHGSSRLWRSPGRRVSFMDKLYGTDAVRKSLMNGDDPSDITATWRSDIVKFRRSRKQHLLYNTA